MRIKGFVFCQLLFYLLFLNVLEKLDRDVFFWYAFLRGSDACEEHGDVFFVVCPLRNCECKAPKIGINCNQSLIILSPFDSSRFSGQTPRI